MGRRALPIALRPSVSFAIATPPFVPFNTVHNFPSQQLRLLSSSSRIINNAGASYDKYYEQGKTGKGSIYDNLYNDEIIPHDKAIIAEVIESTANQKEKEGVLRLLDYGCGPVRCFKVLLECAEKLKEKGILLEYVAYDPSKVGLQVFQEKLMAEGFAAEGESTFYDIAQNSGGTQGYIAGKLKNIDKNLSVVLIHGHVDDKLGHIESTIGGVDATICMFGVLSHIEKREERIKILELLGNVTPKGEIIVTLPGRRILSKENEFFNYMRENFMSDKALSNFIKQTSEPGDLLYTRGAKDSFNKLVIFYHLYYTLKEVEEDFGAAGLQKKIGIQKIGHETTLTRFPVLGIGDMWLSKALSYAPEAIINKIVGYFLIRARALDYKDRKSFAERENRSFVSQLEERRNNKENASIAK